MHVIVGVPARQGLAPERKVFEVHIEQGHKYGAKVVLRGEAGMSEAGVQPGDVIFVLEPKPHKTFKRVGNDLIMDKVRASYCALSWPLTSILLPSRPCGHAACLCAADQRLQWVIGCLCLAAGHHVAGRPLRVQLQHHPP
jgi:hypothetical protein